MPLQDDLRQPLLLRDGHSIPRIGLGTWKAPNSDECIQAVTWALDMGYRLIDTASIYGNEEAVGEAIAQSPVPREEIFLTTKVWNDDQGYDSTLKAIDASLERLQMDYVDLYLIHWPCLNISDFHAAENKRADTWKAMEEIHASGKARSIGVSNYAIEHLREMESYAHVQPAVNQIEFHPFWFRKDLMDYCHAHDIVVEDYCPLLRGEKLRHGTITDIARKHAVTNAQVLLRWGLQHGNVVIPKSTHQERIGENINIFDFSLTDADMQDIDALNENESLLFGKIS